MLNENFQDKVLTEEQTDLVVGGNASNGEVNINSSLRDGTYFYRGEGSSSRLIKINTGKLGN